MNQSSPWQLLRQELDRWQRQGRVATFWWRDDDATQWGPAVARLRTLSTRHDVPIAIAVIPSALQPSLVRGLAQWQRARVCQHGFAHVDHSAGQGKKIELGGGDIAARKRELSLGKERLGGAFGQRFHPVLVPPWNRIDDALVDALQGLGMRGLSTFKARPPAVDTALRQNNCHVDIVDWKATRGFVGDAVALGATVDHLRRRRLHEVAGECTGILSHHLVHDEAGWRFLDRLLALLRTHGAARLLSLGELFP